MNSTTPSDSDVIANLAPLRRYARALSSDEGQAEDLVHDTLVRAYERRATGAASVAALKKAATRLKFA